MGQVDLHVHSTKSDGTFTPTELVNYALEKGLTATVMATPVKIIYQNK